MDRTNHAYASQTTELEPAVECVFFDENGTVEATFTTPLASFCDPLRFGLPDDFIGPPLAPTMNA